jgi:hypothetical protein
MPDSEVEPHPTSRPTALSTDARSTRRSTTEWPRLVMRQSLWRTSRLQYKSVLGDTDGTTGQTERRKLRRW